MHHPEEEDLFRERLHRREEATGTMDARLEEYLYTGDYEACVTLATELLTREEGAPGSVARIRHLLCRCKLRMSDYLGAAEDGRQALALARSAGERGLEGQVLVHLAKAYLGSRHFERALSVLGEFLAGKEHYIEARSLEGEALLCMGQAAAKLQRVDQAAGCFQAARAWWEQKANAQEVQRACTALAALLIKSGRVEEAAHQLAQGDVYIEENPGDVEAHFQHLLNRAEFAFAQGDFPQSVRSANEALTVAEENLELQFQAYMLLHRNAMSAGHQPEALGFALSARVAALDCGRLDLEFEATQAMVDMLRSGGAGLLELLQERYRGHGLDINSYLPDSLFRRPVSEGTGSSEVPGASGEP